MINALFIGFSILVFALVVFAFADCVIRRPPRRLLWLLFILLGFVPISLDLTSGNVSIELLSVLVLGVKVMRNGSGDSTSWIVGFSVPVGALLWLGKSRFWARSHRAKHGVAGVS